MVIYLPTYKWVLDNVPSVQHTLTRIKQQLCKSDIVLLDYNMGDYEDYSKPLSHARLVKLYIEGEYPVFEEQKKGVVRVFPEERSGDAESKREVTKTRRSQGKRAGVKKRSELVSEQETLFTQGSGIA